MAPTTTSNVMTFDQSFYQALNKKAGAYFKEDLQLNWIRRVVVEPNDAPEYKKPKFGNSYGVTGEAKLGLSYQKMDTPKDTIIYPLNYVRGNIGYDVNEMIMEGIYLLQKKGQELGTWEDQVKQAIFKGVRTGAPTAASPVPQMYDAEGKGLGAVLNTGIIEQATLVQDLDGTNSQLIAEI